MNNLLLYISTGLIIIPIIYYGIMILINNKKVSNDTGFNITKDILSQYDSINIIENTGKMTYYNIKRGVIKLNHNCYYKNDLSRVSISLLEAGISGVDKEKNKYINFFKNIFNNLKIIYLFPLIALFFNNIAYTIPDAKLCIVITIICSIFTYLYVSILTEANNWVSKNINKIKSITKENSKKIINYQNSIIKLNNLTFLGELVIIIRMVAIILSLKN